MTRVSANLKKYRSWGCFYLAACGLFFPLILLMMWAFRDFPADGGGVLVYFTFPLVMGLIVGFVELATIQLPMTWCLPGHLKSVRTLVARIGVASCAPIVLALALRTEPLSPLQLVSVVFVSLAVYCLGLAVRVFPFIAAYFWSGIAVLWIALVYLPTTALLFLNRLILETPLFSIVLAAAVCRACWRRLGDRNLIHAFLQTPHLSVGDWANPKKIEAHLLRVREAKQALGARRPDRRLSARIARIKTLSQGDWRRDFLGCLIQIGSEFKWLFLRASAVASMIICMFGYVSRLGGA